MSQEYDHLKRTYCPKLTSAHILRRSSNHYLDALQGSFVEVEGVCRDLFISLTTVKRVKRDGPGDGQIINTLMLDGEPSDKFSCYFNRPVKLNSSLRQLLILQIDKERSSDRFVQALVLEHTNDTEDAYKRVGIIGLACYNLCEVLLPGRRGIMLVAFLHPAERDYGGYAKKHLENARMATR